MLSCRDLRRLSWTAKPRGVLRCVRSLSRLRQAPNPTTPASWLRCGRNTSRRWRASAARQRRRNHMLLSWSSAPRLRLPRRRRRRAGWRCAGAAAAAPHRHSQTLHRKQRAESSLVDVPDDGVARRSKASFCFAREEDRVATFAALRLRRQPERRADAPARVMAVPLNSQQAGVVPRPARSSARVSSHGTEQRTTESRGGVQAHTPSADQATPMSSPGPFSGSYTA